MHISAKRIFTATLLAGLAGCATVEVSAPAAPEVVAPVPSAHWRFDDTRPPAEPDGYRPPRKLAVLLPMTGPMAAAAESVRDGFLAGYYGERRQRPELAFYDTAGSAAGVSAAYAQALAEGADQVVGPLGRDAVAMMMQSPSSVPLLALNAADLAAPENVGSFALSPEDEGTAMGNYLATRNAQRILVLSNGDDNANRSIATLRARLQAAGGDIVDTIAAVGEQPGDISPNLRAAAAREGGIDAVVLAVRGAQARLVVPQLAAAGLNQRLRIATSQITSGTGKADEDRVLDGIVFPGESWTSGSFGGLPAPATLAGSLPTARGPAARLFAFGHDAWLLSGWLYHLATHADASIPGATGQLQLTPEGAVVRTPAWSIWSNGVAVAQTGG